MTLRLLTPDKKGLARRLTEAVASAGGKIEQNRVKREMRGMSETEIVVSFAHPSMQRDIVDSIGQVPGVALLGTEEPRGPAGRPEGDRRKE